MTEPTREPPSAIEEIAQHPIAAFIAVLVILLPALLIGYCSLKRNNFLPSSPASSSTPSKASPVAGTKTIADDGFVGCVSREDTKRLSMFAAQNDREAFGQFLTVRLSTGTCTRFNRGEAVHVMETAGFLAKVRRRGQAQAYWTPFEAVH